MSTSYYALRPIYDSIVITPGEDRTYIAVSNAIHGRVLEIAAKYDYADELIWALLDDVPALRTHFGGPDVGIVVTVNDTRLPDTAPLMSEYHVWTTVGAVKALEGSKKP